MDNLFSQIYNKKIYDSNVNTHINQIFVNAHCNAYHKNEYKLGRKVGCYLLEEGNLDSELFNIISLNQLVYLDSLSKSPNVQIHTLSEPIYDIDNPKEQYTTSKYKTLNPSIYKDGDDIYINVRHASFDGPNYTSMSKDEQVKTKNTFGKLIDNKLSPDYVEIIDCASYLRIKNNTLGFEDLKIFKRNDKWCFVCTSYEASKTTTVLYAVLDDTPDDKYWKVHTAIPFKGSFFNDDKFAEKNWMPILNDSKDLTLVYSVFPLHIVKYNEDKQTVESLLFKQWSKHLGLWRGSSCLVPYKNGYIFVIHEVYFINNARHYVHRFAWMNSSFSILQYSDPFFFEHNNAIEYCNGITLHNEKFYITYGDNDMQAKMMIMPENDVINLLDNIIT